MKEPRDCVIKGELRLRILSKGIVLLNIGLDIAAVDRQ